MGDRGAAMARDRFGLNRQVDEFLDSYAEILAEEASRNALPGTR